MTLDQLIGNNLRKYYANLFFLCPKSKTIRKAIFLDEDYSFRKMCSSEEFDNY